MDSVSTQAIIERLRRADNLQVRGDGNREVYIHDEHRWAAALVYLAQEEGRLPRPANLVVIDRHHDALAPNRECLREIRAVREAGLEAGAVLDLIEDGFSENDDDWIVAAMELGLIADAAVIGGVGIFDRQALVNFDDHAGVEHHIELTGMIGPELAAYGRLGDPRAQQEQERLWRILGWRYEDDAGFSFDRSGPKIAVSIDLDTFVIQWEEFRIPWPEEVFKRWFGETGESGGVPGRKFVEGLNGQAGMLALAREVGHCGGEENAAVVWERVNKYLFDGRLAVR